MPSLTVENYVKTIALIAGRDPAGEPRRDRRARAGAERLAGHRHGDAQDALRGEPGDLHALRGGTATAVGRAAGDEGDPPAPPARALPRPDARRCPGTRCTRRPSTWSTPPPSG